MFNTLKVEDFRQTTGAYASLPADKCNGLFNIKHNGRHFRALISDELNWEHVSVSSQKSAPTWNDMCFFKNLFWDTEDCVLQFHPPKECYVNIDSHCLHLWRHAFNEAQLPPTMMA